MSKSNVRYVGVDLSTFTGLVLLDSEGKVVVEQEIWYPYKKDPERMNYIIDTIIRQLNRETDVICIENFSYNSVSRRQDFQYGIGWLLREHLYKLGYKFYDVAPTSLKKFATGKGNVKKEVMIAPIYRRWGYVNPSDNVTDAFVLAKIAEYINKGTEELKEYEKAVVRAVKTSVLNQDKWEEQKKPPKKRRKIEEMIEEIKE